MIDSTRCHHTMVSTRTNLRSHVQIDEHCTTCGLHTRDIRTRTTKASGGKLLRWRNMSILQD
jgi:hypothetical protein